MFWFCIGIPINISIDISISFIKCRKKLFTVINFASMSLATLVFFYLRRSAKVHIVKICYSVGSQDEIKLKCKLVEPVWWGISLFRECIIDLPLSRFFSHTWKISYQVKIHCSLSHSFLILSTFVKTSCRSDDLSTLKTLTTSLRGFKNWPRCTLPLILLYIFDRKKCVCLLSISILN